MYPALRVWQWGPLRRPPRSRNHPSFVPSPRRPALCDHLCYATARHRAVQRSAEQTVGVPRQPAGLGRSWQHGAIPSRHPPAKALVTGAFGGCLGRSTMCFQWTYAVDVFDSRDVKSSVLRWLVRTRDPSWPNMAQWPVSKIRVCMVLLCLVSSGGATKVGLCLAFSDIGCRTAFSSRCSQPGPKSGFRSLNPLPRK